MLDDTIDELHAKIRELETDYDDLTLERDILKAELRKYEPSDGMMHKLLGLNEAIAQAAELLGHANKTVAHAPWAEIEDWLALPVVQAARKAVKR